MWTNVLLAAPPLGIALTAYSCARLTRPDRNYWPLTRVMWAVLTAIYFGGAVNVLLNAQRSPLPVRLGFNLAMLGALLYARWFMARRNRTPRMFGLRIDGQMTMLSTEEIDHAATIAESAANHGVMLPGRMASLEEAIAEGRRKRRWAEEELPRQAAERRRKKRGGIPDDAAT